MRLYRDFIPFVLQLFGLTCLLQPLSAQQISNRGNLYVGSGAFVGIHGDLENQGELVSEGQIFGFYGPDEILVYGDSPLEIENLEIFKSGGVFLQNSILVSGLCSFQEGDFNGLLSEEEDGLVFTENALALGASAESKSTIWVSTRNRNQFSLPTGSRNWYNPIAFRSEDILAEVSAAYVAENPNFPVSISESFPTGARENGLSAVSSSEFWLLRASGPLSLTLNWNAQSNLESIAEEQAQITLVGWNRNLGQWIPIVTTARSGDLEEGSLGTAIFNAPDYEAVTFGVLGSIVDPDDVDGRGYFVSPNGDGINDALVLEHLELEGRNNRIFIFNRSGQKVFEYTDYFDEFTGFANNGSLIVDRSSRLPNGVYYYLVELPDEGLTYQGYFVLED